MEFTPRVYRMVTRGISASLAAHPGDPRRRRLDMGGERAYREARRRTCAPGVALSGSKRSVCPDSRG